MEYIVPKNLIKKVKNNPTIWYPNGVMDLFKKYIDSCDILAYRSHVDLRIPSGVMFEVDYAIEINKPVFELPTLTTQRRMTYEETIEYLKYNGQKTLVKS